MPSFFCESKVDLYSNAATYLYRDGRSPPALVRIDRLLCSSNAFADKRRAVLDQLPFTFLQVKLVDERIDSLVSLIGVLGEQEHLVHGVLIQVVVQLVEP